MPQRGPYSKSAAKREEILSAALRTISENGYTGATVQQVADAVGMSKPGVLHHFGSRDALFTAVLARRDEVNTTAYPITPGAFEFFTDTMRHNATVPGLVALFSALTGVATSDPSATESREFFSARYPRVVDNLADVVRVAQQNGTVRSDLDPIAAARLLVAAADGVQAQWLLDPAVDMAAELELLWSLMLR